MKKKSSILPIIDLQSPFFIAAKEIDLACRDTGFFLIRGHDVDIKFIKEFFNCLYQFFNLPLEEKMKYEIKKIKATSYNETCPYGYSRLASENAYAFMGEKGPNDIVEKISVGPDILQNKLLTCLPYDAEFQTVMKTFYQLFQNLALVLSELFALAIDLPQDFFIKKIDKAHDVLRCQAYPSLDQVEGNHGFAPHTDMGLLTILMQNQNGLEILDKKNKWQKIEVPSLDTFVINIGDLMMHWTNDEWISTKHRVLLTEQSRISTAFFKIINEDALVECFPKFCLTKPPRYSPFSYSDFATEKMNRLYS